MLATGHLDSDLTKTDSRVDAVLLCVMSLTHIDDALWPVPFGMWASGCLNTGLTGTDSHVSAFLVFEQGVLTYINDALVVIPS